MSLFITILVFPVRPFFLFYFLPLCFSLSFLSSFCYCISHHIIHLPCPPEKKRGKETFGGEENRKEEGGAAQQQQGTDGGHTKKKLLARATFGLSFNCL